MLGISVEESKDILKKLPVLDMKTTDAIVRLKEERTARDVAKQIESWFEKYPGYRGHAAAKAG